MRELCYVAPEDIHQGTIVAFEPFTGGQLFQRSTDKRQRCTELVTGIGIEERLLPVDGFLFAVDPARDNDDAPDKQQRDDEQPNGDNTHDGKHPLGVVQAEIILQLILKDKQILVLLLHLQARLLHDSGIVGRDDDALHDVLPFVFVALKDVERQSNDFLPVSGIDISAGEDAFLNSINTLAGSRQAIDAEEEDVFCHALLPGCLVCILGGKVAVAEHDVGSRMAVKPLAHRVIDLL